MSSAWTGYFFSQTDLTGSELLLAIAIADDADGNGHYYPQEGALASKIRASKTDVSVWLRKLIGKGYLKVNQEERVRFELCRTDAPTVPAQATPALDIYRDAFPKYQLTPFQIDILGTLHCTEKWDSRLWKESVTWWAQKGYQERNLPGMIEHYREKRDGTPAQSPNQQTAIKFCGECENGFVRQDGRLSVCPCRVK